MAQSAQISFPIFLNLIVHLDGGYLIDADNHALTDRRLCIVIATEFKAAHEMAYQVFGDLFQSVVASNQVVFPRELTLQLFLLIVVQFRCLDERFQILFEVFVGELKFGDSIFVEQRDGRTIFNRLLEVVNADVLAKDFLRLLFARHQRRAGEANKRRVGEGIPHVQSQRVVLATVGLVGHHDDVAAIGQLRILLARFYSELLNQCENESVVFTEKLF